MQGQCSADLTDKYFRIAQDITYSNQNEQFNWDIRINGATGGISGKWAIT